MFTEQGIEIWWRVVRTFLRSVRDSSACNIAQSDFFRGNIVGLRIFGKRKRRKKTEGTLRLEVGGRKMETNEKVNEVRSDWERLPLPWRRISRTPK